MRLIEPTATSVSRRFPAFAALAALLAALFVVAAPAADAAPARCLGRAVTIVAVPGVPTVGTQGNDVIVGNRGNDVIDGRGGNDRICGLGGADRISGGGGADRLHGGAGNDTLRGGAGNDHLNGGRGDDLIIGQAGNDVMNGLDGGDVCPAGRGRDRTTRCTAQRADSGIDVASLEARMVDHVNTLRAGVGLGPLRSRAAMADVARSWSATLATSFRHNPNVGSQLPPGWRLWAENIGYRVDSSSSAQETMDAVFWALAQSPGHYANMTHPDLTHIGIGIHIVGDGVYVTQVFARY